MNFFMDSLYAERANSFFENVVHIKVKLAFRIMAYFDVKPEYKIDPDVKTLFLAEKYAEAIEVIYDNINETVECSNSQQNIMDEAIMFAKKCHKRYVEQRASERDKERIKLMQRLKELEEEEKNV
ncbi:MAG: hypothetical protein Q7R33_04950 [Nitrosarchaeum sp.]|nr:hypothetical protein [Nitrosarchaeum sp.]